MNNHSEPIEIIQEGAGRDRAEIAEFISRFQRILAVAEEVRKGNPEGLRHLVKLVGRRIQADTALNWGSVPRRDCDPSDYFPMSEPLTKDGHTFDDLVRPVRPTSLSLVSDLVLPWPWNPERLAKALVGLADGGNWGDWRQDDNHLVVQWLPMNIGWVHGGNHSIAAGIAMGSGEVMPEEAYDLTALFDHVYCDGGHYRRAHDDSIIAAAPCEEFAAIFEISRLILDPETQIPARSLLGKLSFAVKGLPPIKNEALSLLNANHKQAGRVTALLVAARAAMTAAGLVGGFGGSLVALEVALHSPTVPPNGDATNFLGGIGDVLQGKGRNLDLAHLGPLADVCAFDDDKQVVQLAYRAVRDQTEFYIVQITPLRKAL